MDEQKKNYELAVEYMKVKDAVDDDYLSAAELFTEAGDYLDAAQKAEECKALAEKCRERLLNEKKRRKRTGDLLAWLAVIVCVAAIISVKVLPDIKICSAAQKAFKDGDYAAAHAELTESKDGFVSFLYANRLHYSTAQRLFSNGEYVLAAEAYGKLGNYSDSEKNYILSLEKEADKCALKGDEAGAKQAVDSLRAIKEYADKLNETVYATAVKLTESHEYQTAFEMLKTVKDYKDSAALIEQIPEKCYKHAEECYKSGDSDKAIHFFVMKCMKYYKDSINRGHKISYEYGCEMLENREYEKAEKYLLVAKNYDDTAAALNETYYEWGKALMESGEYEKAIEKFDIIQWYKDTVQYKSECHYILACSLEESGENEKALKKFASVSGYKDSDERAARLENK
ncbi:MAG: hypothetical protein MJ177_08600 [Clostridia bacterium]|nr:hypothetical protein [Clostridia bacterium]